jgi:predicted methyltransferase
LNNRFEEKTEFQVKDNEGSTDGCLQEVSRNVNIEDGKQCIEKVLIDIYFKKGISTKELARNNRLPIPVIAAIKKEFIKNGLVVQERGVTLTSKGKDFVEEELGFKGLNKDLYIKLLLEPWKDHKEILEVKEALKEIFIMRPQANVAIDQTKCTIDTAVKRGILALINSVLIGKKTLCLGDDDMISIAIGFLLKKLYSNMKYYKTSISVLDIDQRVLTYIERIAEEESLPIECELIDFRSPIPEKFNNSYDCFFTDPPYTLSGMNLFISRGVEALKGESGIPVFLSYAHKSPDFDLTMQRCFVDMGLMVSEILTRFNSYEGAAIIGNTGQMIILKTTSKTRTLVEDYYDKPIYTGELKATIRDYRCTQCNKIIKVGATERFKTIEELKAKGCVSCNNERFTIVERLEV